MLGGTRVVRVWARTCPTDLRNGFRGLTAIVERELGRDVRAGDLFLFVNRRRDSARVLLHDGTGTCIYAKKLDELKFAKLWRRPDSQRPIELTMAELNLFLEGAEKQRKQGRVPG